jgi:Glycosyltransferase Family 4
VTEPVRTEPLRVAVLEHDSTGAAERLAAALAREGAEVAVLGGDEDALSGRAPAGPPDGAPGGRARPGGEEDALGGRGRVGSAEDALGGRGRVGSAKDALGGRGGDTGRVERVRTVRVPDLPLRLRKIGEAPGRMPGALLALARGRYEVAHAFTAQDAVVAVAWSRLGGGPVVFTQREPLTRANVADRRLRLRMLTLALEGSSAVIAPDEAVASSVRRWMAVDPEVIAPEDGTEHMALYARLLRR